MSPLDLMQRSQHMANVRAIELAGLRASMWNLGRCLRDAGMLCEAYVDGFRRGLERVGYWQ